MVAKGLNPPLDKGMALPPVTAWADFDALHDQPALWRDALAAIAARHSSGPVRQMTDGSALVALVGQQLAIKLYPPFLRDHFAFEQALLPRLHGRLNLPTPALLASGEHEGWPYLVMSQLPGQVLTHVWPALDETHKCQLLLQLGRLVAQVHALPVENMAALAPPWSDFFQQQRSRCHSRQLRTGLPARLLAQLDGFVQGPLPNGPMVILTGEYTPMNLLAQGGKLVGMYDFGDGLVGAREYDWLGPLCFLAAGYAERCAAFMDGYGAVLDDNLRLSLMRLLLLHRYSNLPAQIACPGWQDATDFQALAAGIWP